ncbi:DUF2784 domain-containing protein [Bdellovibrio sp. 22V]|uniref:DUF2784 domain-containing protein n=1 Tax=Bdellovibrio sp. 22V TaxID=3044166 RepID=UPI0025435BAE|nr:DUF2784 domain-containing protein [Bdellovibrio sp. 22V]WII72739.1 DUF2784 domain-containing protein [Bdellovibrio sp. 22V]
MDTSTLADIILYAHFLYVLGVVVPIPLIVIGARRGWSWIRNRTLRRIHFAMILIVVFESLIGMMCPLTVWEEALRKGDPAATDYSQGFIATWISRVMFFSFPPWIFTLQYLLVALLIWELYIWIPPRR